jgi:putative redox protein
MAEDALRKARVTWIEGLQFMGLGEASGATCVLDGAREDGGMVQGLRPMEALLISLGGCTGMDVISILHKKKQRVTGFRINIRGTRAEEHPRRFVHIELEYVVRGWEISEQAVARSIELSQTKYCSVSASLKSEVTYTYRIEQEPVAAQMGP